MHSPIDIVRVGGPLVWPLFVCGSASLAVSIDRLIFLANEESNASITAKEVPILLSEDRGSEAAALCIARPSLLGALVQSTIVQGKPTRSEGLFREAMLGYRRALTSHLSVLDTVITVAPLLGLLGTVTGMIKSFRVVGGTHGIGQPSAVTGGISEALIATAIGLGIAIFSLVALNYFRARTEGIADQTEIQARRILRLPRMNTEKGDRRLKVQKPEEKRPRIEIIPMIDTIFFLLVFFMISSLSMVTMPTKQVRLPGSSAGNSANSDRIVVSLTRTGDYLVDKSRADAAEVAGLLSEKVHMKPLSTLVINCDKDQSVGKFMLLLAAAKSANPSKIVVATSPQPGVGK